jgi:CubicO group peptidase (beta-lactamase class C family)
MKPMYRNFLFVAILAAGCVASSQQVASESHSESIEAARTYAEELRASKGYPGLSAAVAIDGDIVWAEGFGHSDVESGTPATSLTQYRVGSVSKMLTMGAVALLMEQGKLDMDSDVRNYVPEFPEKKKGVVTTRLLTAHMGGVSHYKFTDKPDTERPHYESVIDALNEFKDHRLNVPPGTRSIYSSYGWNLISAVVERAAGQPFLEYMDESVFKRLSLKSTLADKNELELSLRSKFYEVNEAGEIVEAPTIDVSYKWAGGGFLSTVEDLVTYGSAWLPGSTFLKKKTLNEVFTNQKTSKGDEVLYGIGWRIQQDPDGKPVYHHGGNIMGGRAFIMILPEERLVVALLTNRTVPKNLNLQEAFDLASFFIK